MKGTQKSFMLLMLFFSVLSFAQKSILKSDISKIISGKKATVAVSVLGFEDPFQFNIDGNKQLPMLSVFKFHIALAVLNRVDEGKLDLNENIFIKKSDLLENTWSPIGEKYPDGNIEMPLSELLKYTVAQSDNNGCDILLRLIDGTKIVQDFINSKGIKNFQIKADEAKMHQSYKAMYSNFTTTNSANDLLKKFYNGQILSRNSTDFLMKVMIETTTGTNKIVAQLPKGTPVAHKTGSSGKDDKGLTIAENDIAIITLADGTHYAISIFVSDSTESADTNTKMIADVSKIVFDYFSK